MDNLTPAMRQYMQIKHKYKDCVVFFRMGDFYETFYEDAKTTAEALDIALTKRGMKKDGQSIPLAGIPYHALDMYLAKMIKKGHKVAIVEQMEDPKLAKGIVKRDVVRIVTPGTVIEENILSDSNNYIASLSPGKSKYGLSFVDISTGEFIVTEATGLNDILIEIQKQNPSEVILPLTYETDEKTVKILKDAGIYVTYHSDVDFYEENAAASLQEHFNILSLDGFGLREKTRAVSSAGALLSYLYETQKNALRHITKIKPYSTKESMIMDITTVKNLELVRNLRDGSEKNTLLSVLNKTQTSMGYRLLKKVIMKPLVNLHKINERLVAVEELFKNNFLLEELIELLKKMSDLERLVSRVSMGHSNPRDLVSLHGSLEIIPEVKALLEDVESVLLIKLADMDPLRHLTKQIDEIIVDEPPVSVSDGKFVKEGYNDELDELRRISTNAKKIIREIESKERESTGIKSLKVRYNRIFGYYIEVTRTNSDNVPEHYIKKQTLVNSERFATPELKELEEKILTAEEKSIAIEISIFEDLITAALKEISKLQKISENISYLDVLCSFAKVSQLNRYVKPQVASNFKLSLKTARHPVVEIATQFVPNDTIITEQNRVKIITGPNMAGKTCYMRQVALNVIMAQMGCFVPADEAEINIVDKVFCRTGASDDISQGQSTFMVEMSETAQILNNATEKSLIVLDEIGRGTSTYDGVSIAWAVAEYIATQIKAKTLFATHYHVLNNLEKEIPCVKNYNIAVSEREDRIIFLRKILEGGTDKSYGIHVARLAGMPMSVINKSKELQFRLENEDKIAEKIIVETRKSVQKDFATEEIEEVERLIKTRQMRLDEV